MPASGGMASGRTLVPGRGAGEVLRLEEPLSLWGGMDPRTGNVIDPHHPQAGQNMAGRVVCMPSGRGSSSSSSILAEAIRAGCAPAAFLLLEADPILALGAIVAAELYGRTIPVVVLDESAFMAVAGAERVVVEATTMEATVRIGP
jgi:predicted aconitase with swiveling domain